MAHKTNVENNKFPESNFTQNIRIALFLKEYEWANEFIEDIKKYIKNKQLITLSKAEILYHQGDYDALYIALDKISRSKYKDVYEVKCLYAKALYDTEQYGKLDTFLYSFDKFLLRQKGNSEEMLAFKLGFVRYLKRMLKNECNVKKCSKLYNEVLENKSVFHRNWLLSKLKNLKS